MVRIISLNVELKENSLKHDIFCSNDIEKPDKKVVTRRKDFKTR